LASGWTERTEKLWRDGAALAYARRFTCSPTQKKEKTETSRRSSGAARLLLSRLKKKT